MGSATTVLPAARRTPRAPARARRGRTRFGRELIFGEIAADTDGAARLRYVRSIRPRALRRPATAVYFFRPPTSATCEPHNPVTTWLAATGPPGVAGMLQENWDACTVGHRRSYRPVSAASGAARRRRREAAAAMSSVRRPPRMSRRSPPPPGRARPFPLAVYDKDALAGDHDDVAAPARRRRRPPASRAAPPPSSSRELERDASTVVSATTSTRT